MPDDKPELAGDGVDKGAGGGLGVAAVLASDSRDGVAPSFPAFCLFRMPLSDLNWLQYSLYASGLAGGGISELVVVELGEVKVAVFEGILSDNSCFFKNWRTSAAGSTPNFRSA